MSNVMFSRASDEWETPAKLFDGLNAIYHFTLDAAATDVNALCLRWFTREQDGLAQSWAGETVWCNPPYGRQIAKWVKKAWEESRKPGTKVVMLLLHEGPGEVPPGAAPVRRSHGERAVSQHAGDL